MRDQLLLWPKRMVKQGSEYKIWERREKGSQIPQSLVTSVYYQPPYGFPRKSAGHPQHLGWYVTTKWVVIKMSTLR